MEGSTNVFHARNPITRFNCFGRNLKWVGLASTVTALALLILGVLGMNSSYELSRRIGKSGAIEIITSGGAIMCIVCVVLLCRCKKRVPHANNSMPDSELIPNPPFRHGSVLSNQINQPLMYDSTLPTSPVYRADPFIIKNNRKALVFLNETKKKVLNEIKKLFLKNLVPNKDEYEQVAKNRLFGFFQIIICNPKIFSSYEELINDVEKKLRILNRIKKVEIQPDRSGIYLEGIDISSAGVTQEQASFFVFYAYSLFAFLFLQLPPPLPDSCSGIVNPPLGATNNGSLFLNEWEKVIDDTFAPWSEKDQYKELVLTR